VLRAAKNRFGATHELGIFEMGERGLEEVAHPSAAFLSDYLDTAFDVIRQMLFSPRFDEKKLEKEKKIKFRTGG
jgi:hypothetical protein